MDGQQVIVVRFCMAGIGIKRSEQVPGSSGASKMISDAMSLFSGFNKMRKGGGGLTEELDQAETLLSLDIDDEKLLAMQATWLSEYEKYEATIRERQEQNKKYWLGKHYRSESSQTSVVDNLIFESLETLLPNITRANPSPWVKGEDSEEGRVYSDQAAKIIEQVIDENALKLKLKRMARQWAIYFIGALKLSWDQEEDRLCVDVIHPRNLILDPKAIIEGGRYNGRYLGEYKSMEAKTLASKFPEKAEEIMKLVDDREGKMAKCIEWWTPKFVFWTLGGTVLDKRENPNWNYESKEEKMDEMGMMQVMPVTQKNHLRKPEVPYSFLSVFVLDEQPHDQTSLVEQCISMQDLVNKRVRQIDKNADDTNNGWVFNNQFTEEQANEALLALRQGGAILSPTASIGDSVQRIQAPPLASYVLEDMLDKREQIRNIMGVRGSTAQGLMNEKTVRGKIEIKGQDSDRGSGIVEPIEQCVDWLFNLITQFVYVYYEPQNFEDVLTPEEAAQFKQQMQMPVGKITVSVKENSMIPQDPLMRRNEAIDLFQMGLLDPETTLKRLDFPKPEETIAKLQMAQQPQMAAPPPAGAIPMNLPRV